jgi:hypothetical protein
MTDPRQGSPRSGYVSPTRRTGEDNNGVLYAVDDDDMTKFDERERGNARVEAPREDIEAVSWQQLPQTGKIWVYIPVKPNGEPGVGLPAANAEFPLLRRRGRGRPRIWRSFRARIGRDDLRLERLLAERSRIGPPALAVRPAIGRSRPALDVLARRGGETQVSSVLGNLRQSLG